MTSFFWGAAVPLTPGLTILEELFIVFSTAYAHTVHHMTISLLASMC